MANNYIYSCKIIYVKLHILCKKSVISKKKVLMLVLIKLSSLDGVVWSCRIFIYCFCSSFTIIFRFYHNIKKSYI
jgi:hypothetical protein